MKKLPGIIFLTISISTVLVILFRFIFNINFIGLYELIGILSGFGVVSSLIIADSYNSHIEIELVNFDKNSIFIKAKTIVLVLLYGCFCISQFYAALISWNIGYKTSMLEIRTFIFYIFTGLCFLVIFCNKLKCMLSKAQFHQLQE